MSLLFSKKYKQRGVALITVMLIVALCAVIASQMSARMQMQLQRSANMTFNQQAFWYAMAAEELTKRVLITAFEEDTEVTHLGQIWAKGETTYPVEQGEITGEITDLQSCLNLNALRKPPDSSTTASSKELPARVALETLLINLQMDGVSQFEAESMVESLTDWLDENDELTGSGGAEDNDYASREFPYLAANNFLASVNELRVIANFTPAIINEIAPYVCIIPFSEQHMININTIDAQQPELLQALLDSTAEEAEQVLGARGEEGFDTIDDFYNLPEIIKLKLSDSIKEQFVVDSEYFTLKASTSFNNSFFAMKSVMKVTNNKYIDVISRTIGRN